jgi:protein-tyrosine phosphatase
MASDTMTDVLHDDRRRVMFEAVHNFRDLGGYPTSVGGVTRWNVLYRADGLHRLTVDDLKMFDDLGVGTVVDLRTDLELEQHGTFPHTDTSVDFHHVPVIDATWNHEAMPDLGDVDFLVWAYRSMLSAGSARFADAIEILADVDGPAVFHCAAGKDRTGLLAALVLGLLGVPDEVIVADYALTQAGMERMRAWAEHAEPEMYARWLTMPAAHAAAEPEAMARLLADLRAAHGTVRAYVRSLGVPTAALDALEAELLD